MSGFPVLLPELQRHFIVLMFHKYSQSFNFPTGQRELTDSSARECSSRFSWALLPLTLPRSELCVAQGGQRRQGTEMALRHPRSPRPAGAARCLSRTRSRAGITRCLWPCHRWHQQLPGSCTSRWQRRDGRAGMSGPCCNVTFPFHPCIAPSQIHKRMKEKPASRVRVMLWKGQINT